MDVDYIASHTSLPDRDSTIPTQVSFSDSSGTMAMGAVAGLTNEDWHEALRDFDLGPSDGFNDFGVQDMEL